MPFLTKKFFDEKKCDLISQLRSVIIFLRSIVGFLLKDFKSRLRLLILFFMFQGTFSLITLLWWSTNGTSVSTILISLLSNTFQNCCTSSTPIFQSILDSSKLSKSFEGKLATLLEGAGYLLFKISSANSKNIQIWMNKCVKLEINLRIVNNVPSTTLLNRRNLQIANCYEVPLFSFNFLS